jgi:uncharacterized protein (TIGR02996 family)
MGGEVSSHTQLETPRRQNATRKSAAPLVYTGGMNPTDALYRAVCAAPHDDLPRLVYADWLEENGRAARAEFIRVQCRLANASPADADYVDLLEREAELKAILWRELEADRQPLPVYIGWEPEHRGFAERLRFGHNVPPNAASLLKNCSAVVPISGLRFDRLSDEGLQPFAAAFGSTISSLEVPDLRTGTTPIAPAGVFPALRRLVFGERCDPTDLRRLTINARLRELSVQGYATLPPAWEGLTTEIRVFEFRLGLSGITAPLPALHTLRVGRFAREDWDVFNSLPSLASLTVWTQNGDWVGLVSKRNRPLAELRMNFNPSPKAADSLFRREWFQELRMLVASGDPVRMRGACASARLTGLRQLRIPHGKKPLTVEDLLRGAYWHSLTTFEIPQYGWKGAECARLVARVTAPNLKHLNLMGVPLGDAGAVALAENESFANLTRLNLSACRIGPRGVEALLNSPHLQRLIELNLYANQGGEALAALADPGVLPNLGLADVAANGVSDELRRRLDHRPAIRAR